MDKELETYLKDEFGNINKRFDRVEANTDTLLDLVVEQSNKDRSEVQKDIDAAVVLMAEQENKVINFRDRKFNRDLQEG